MSHNCSPLLRQYGTRFRVFNEAEDRPARTRDDPGNLIIRGRSGFVALVGYGGLLVACTNSTATTKRILTRVPGAKVVQEGDDGANITFAPEQLDVVADILRLRKKRRLTPPQREAAAAHLEKVRPKPLSGASVSPQIPPISPPAGENPAEAE